MTADQVDGGPIKTCPDCGSPLNFTLPGFRPATPAERARLTPAAVRVLGLCPNPLCPAKIAANLRPA
jgi:hypothetical protein